MSSFKFLVGLAFLFLGVLGDAQPPRPSSSDVDALIKALGPSAQFDDQRLKALLKDPDVKAAYLAFKYRIDNDSEGATKWATLDASTQLFGIVRSQAQIHGREIDFEPYAIRINERLRQLELDQQTIRNTWTPKTHFVQHFNEAFRDLMEAGGSLKGGGVDLKAATSIARMTVPKVLEKVYEKDIARSLHAKQWEIQNSLYEVEKAKELIFLRAYATGYLNEDFRKNLALVAKGRFPASAMLFWSKEKEIMEANPDLNAYTRLIPNALTKFNELEDRFKKTFRQEIELALETRDAKATAEAIENAKIEFDVQTSRTSVNMLSLLTRLSGDEKAAKGVYVLGNSTVDIVSALHQYNRARVQLASAPAGASVDKMVLAALTSKLNLAMAVANAFGSILSFIIGGGDGTQVILDHIKDLARQVAALHQNMKDRFDHVDRSLSLIFRTMVREFDALKLDVEWLKANSREINQSLNVIHEQLSRLEATNYLYFRIVARMGFQKDLNRCIADSRGSFSTSEFESCVVDFRTIGEEHFRNPLFSGVAEERKAAVLKTDYLASLKNMVDAHPWQRVASLGALADREYGDSSFRVMVENKKVGMENAEYPVNVVEWYGLVQQFQQFLVRRWEYAAHSPGVVQTTTQALLNAGEQASAAMERLRKSSLVGIGDYFSKEEKRADKSAMMGAFVDYSRLLADLKDRIKAKRAEFEKQEGQGVSLLDPMKKLGPVTNAGKDIFPCSDYKVDKPAYTGIPDPRLDALKFDDQDLSPALPDVVRLAANLKLGTVSVCYRNLDWHDAEAVQESLAKDRIHSLLSMRLEIRYQPLHGEKPLLVAVKYIKSDKKKFAHAEQDYEVISYADPTQGPGLVMKRVKPTTYFADRGATDDLKNQRATWKEVFVSYIWNIEEYGGLRTRWVKEATEIGDKVGHKDEIAKSLEAVQKSVDSVHADLKDNFEKKIVEDLATGSSRIGKVGEALDVARALLLNYLYFAFPESFNDNDQLRGAFYGVAALPDSAFFIRAPQAKMPLDPDRGGAFKEAEARLTAFEGVLKSFAKGTPEGLAQAGRMEKHAILEDGIRTLARILKLSRLGLPQESVRATSSRLEARVDEIAQMTFAR